MSPFRTPGIYGRSNNRRFQHSRTNVERHSFGIYFIRVTYVRDISIKISRAELKSVAQHAAHSNAWVLRAACGYRGSWRFALRLCISLLHIK